MSEAIFLPQFPPDLSNYALKDHTHSQYLTAHQSLINYATKTYVQQQISAIDFPDAGVVTFNGRAGAVVPKTGDYTASMVGAAATSHTHDTYALTTHNHDDLYALKSHTHPNLAGIFHKGAPPDDVTECIGVLHVTSASLPSTSYLSLFYCMKLSGNWHYYSPSLDGACLQAIFYSHALIV